MGQQEETQPSHAKGIWLAAERKIQLCKTRQNKDQMKDQIKEQIILSRKTIKWHNLCNITLFSCLRGYVCVSRRHEERQQLVTLPEKIGMVSSGWSLASVSERQICDREYGPDSRMSWRAFRSRSSRLSVGPTVNPVLTHTPSTSTPSALPVSMESGGATVVTMTSSRKKRL